MNTLLLEYYLKFNVLLAGVFILWQAMQTLLSLAGLEQRPALRLQQARLLLSAIFAVPLLLALGDWINIFGIGNMLSQMVPGMIVGEKSVADGIATGLDQRWRVMGSTMSASMLVGMAILGGIVIRAVMVFRNWRALRLLVQQSTILHRYSQLEVLVSEKVGTPFSTRALGRNQVVLPYDLIQSPRTFNIAVRHEIQHLRNGDLDWVMLLEGLRLLCFWNPFVYLWQNTFDCLQEFACDEALVRGGRLSSTQYGNCLLEVAAREDEPRLFASSYMVPRFSLWGDAQHPLKKRILMLSRRYGSRMEKMKSVLMALAMSVIVIGCSNTVFTENAETDRSYLPITTVPPKYPNMALQQKRTAWVQTQFDVDKAGNVINAEVLKKCVTSPDEAICVDDATFDSASLEAIRQFKFEPRLEKGKAVETTGVQYVFTYCLSECSPSDRPESILLQE